jgi:hypothetical protein
MTHTDVVAIEIELNSNNDADTVIMQKHKNIKNALTRAKNQCDKEKYPTLGDDPHDFLTVGLNAKARNRITENKVVGDIQVHENSDVIVNPFFVPLSGGSALDIPNKDFYTSYSYCYALLLKSNVANSDMISKIYKRLININELKELCSMFKLCKISIKLLHNNRFKKVTNLINSNILNTLFNESETNKTYEFQENEMIVPLFNLSESNARGYLSLYTVTQTIGDLPTIMSTINLFNSDYTIPIDKSVQRLLDNIDSNSFWTLAKNCSFPLFKIFDKRTFSYNGVRLHTIRSETLNGSKNINQLIDNIEKQQIGYNKAQKSRKIRKEESDKGYQLPGNDITDNKENVTNGDKRDQDEFSKAEHQNLYKLLKNQPDRTFYINNTDIPVTKNDIADIFDRITNDKYRFKLFNAMLTSKEYCHLVVNNKRVLIKNSDHLSKYRPFYAYAFGYAWNTLYLEEAILSTKSTRFNRHAFDLETAQFLPTFPFTKSDLRKNPYLTLLLPDDIIDPSTNMIGLHAPHDHKKYHGLTSPEEAKRRFNVFCTGDPDKDMFDIKGIDPTVLSVSGSIMPACLQKLSPLFEKCSSKDADYVVRWKSFFKHYYGDSDIDLMCKCSSISKLIMYGSVFIKHLMELLNIERSDIVIKPDKKSAIIVTKHFFKECVDDVNDVMGSDYSSNDLIEMFNQGDALDKKNKQDNANESLEELLQEYFYTDYTSQKGKRNVEWRKSKKDSEIAFDKELERSFTTLSPFENFAIKMVSYDISESSMTNKRDSEFYFFVNDFRDDDNKVSAEDNYLVFKYSESLKFKIDSDKMQRCVEMFQIREFDSFNTVARFHLPCVRAYYQENKFWLLPSFITAMHTGLNIDYKYFAGSRDPANICQKYVSRGFGMILNSSEKRGIVAYSQSVDEFNGMYKANKASDIFGPKDIDHNYFCPGVFKLGLDKSVYTDPGTRFAKSNEDVHESYKTETGYDADADRCIINMFNLRTIDKTGDVVPYKNWIGDAFYDYMQSI